MTTAYTTASGKTMSNSQVKNSEKQIISLNASAKEKDAAIAFGAAIYKIGEFASCIRQTITFNRCAILKQIMEGKGMPKMEGDNLINEFGVPCQVLGLSGNEWISGNIRVKIVFELITEKKIESIQEAAMDSFNSPLDNFRD